MLNPLSRFFAWPALLLLGALSSMGSLAQAQGASGSSAPELRAKFEQLAPLLKNNAFRRPLVIDSSESSGQVRGDVYAVVEHPFGKVQQALRDPARWCDVMILHPNTKQCEPPLTGQSVLKVAIGKKLEQPAEDAYPLNLSYSLASSAPDYFQVQLRAAQGPLGTSNYRFVVEAVSLPNNRSFIHLSYSYASSMAGHLATKAYLATAGRSKVGFSRTGVDEQGNPVYIGGVRGAVERNAMRYYLAIDACLQALDTPGDQRFERRLERFLASMEQYPRQLHEMDGQTFLDIKRRQHARQRQAGTQVSAN
ncbi:MAG: hypothetical protein EOP36_18800 [Rubrivivax sp.]|nr:MAG: hypothetical protein EOP36_18800 [Rubrivivax sp.]